MGEVYLDITNSQTQQETSHKLRLEQFFFNFYFVAFYSVFIAAAGALAYKVSEIGVKCLYNKLSNRNFNIKQNDLEAGNSEDQSFIQNNLTSNFICLNNFHSKRSPSNIFSIGSLMNKLTGLVINFN